MGSVVEHVECPECNYKEATNDYYYKSGEEYVNCPQCGYSYSQTRKRNPKNKNLYLEDGSEEEHYDIKEEKNDISYCVDALKDYGITKKQIMSEWSDYFNYCVEMDYF